MYKRQGKGNDMNFLRGVYLRVYFLSLSQQYLNSVRHEFGERAVYP